ncbi:MAG: hypothetical protein JNK53_01775 [Phycisphaerae bacterium]|nr:hypothetical protein [Phycisphaerae bacterium]
MLISTQASASDGHTPQAIAAPKPRTRTPVLAQGALISSAPGSVGPSATDQGLVVFVLEESLLGHVRRKLTLMPSDPSDDVKDLLRSPTADTPWRYEVSGQVYDYQGRAFLLPIAIVALRNPPVPPYLARVAPPELVAPAQPIEPARAPLLNAYLQGEHASGPTRGGPATVLPHESALSSIAATDDDFAAELERRLARGVKDRSAAKLPEARVDRTMVMPAGIRLQDRRASITRDPVTGVWRAVLEAAPTAGAPTAMELLPCRELERVERAVKISAVGTPWLVSGEIVASGTRNYLLLTRAREQPKDRWLFR